MNTNVEQRTTASGELRKLLRERKDQRRLHVNRQVLEGVLHEMVEAELRASKALDKMQIQLLKAMDRLKGWVAEQHGEAAFETAARRDRAAAKVKAALDGGATSDDIVALIRAGVFEEKK